MMLPALLKTFLLLTAFITATGCRGGGQTVTRSTESSGQAAPLMPVEAIVGVWTVSAATASDKGRCRLALSQQGPGLVRGLVVEVCSIEAAALARGWQATIAGFELLDASQKPLMRFRRIDVDHFETLDGRYRMERTAMA